MDRDPDERPADGGHDAGDVGDSDVFESIVADWRADGSVPEWPTTPPRGTDKLWFGETAPEDTPPDTPADPPVVEPPPAAVVRPSPTPEDEHFVPPEPPPLPRLGPPAAVGLVLLVLGLVLVSAPGWLGMSSVYGLPLGLLSLAAGLGWLVLRLWPTGSAPDDEDDDGAVL